MKKLTLALATILALATWTFAGPERYSGKEMKQVAPPPCPEFYADSEWNIGLWGAYAFSGNDDNGDDNDFDPNTFLFLNGETVHFDNGNTFLGDNAWGGGADIKYFFHRYFGIGIEAFGLGSNDDNNDDHDVPPAFRAIGLDPHDDNNNNGGAGAVLGTFTLRYPFHCSRFSPYIWGGAGVIFGSNNNDHGDETFVYLAGPGVFVRANNHDDNNNGDDAEFIGQVGAGLEIRFTPHVGWITDFSWNFTSGDHNDNNGFGMVRGGFNFAF
jgi:hypothetical protein